MRARVVYEHLNLILKGIKTMSRDLAGLKADADATVAAVRALIARVDAAVAKLTAAADDPAKIQEISDELTAATAAAAAELPDAPPVPAS